MLSYETNQATSYQKLIDRIEDLAWIADETGRIHLANAAWTSYTGRSLLARPVYFWEQVSPEEKARYRNLASASICQHKLKLKDAAGNYSLCEVELELLASEPISLWIGTASILSQSDLASYKQKEIELQRSVEFVRRIMESSQDCIKVLDLQGRLLYMNDGGQDIMEIDDFAKVQNEPWLCFWQGRDRQAAAQAFNAAKSGSSGKFDGYCATAKGTPKWWEVAVTPMFDEDGRVCEILSVSRDITVRKVAEKTLQQRNQELDRFSSIVSHDLKAPLRGISSISQWLIEDLGDRLPEENQQQLNLLGQRVERMNALIDGLLKLSRVGQQKLSVELVDVADLLQEVVDSLSPPPGIAIEHEALPVISTKRLLLSQVLSNLISNAIKHHDKEIGKIQITAKDCNTHYEFAIADDGPGIPVSERERVFEMFQTLNDCCSTTNTGIGLALVQKIVLEEGGQLWLESNTPQGCIFYFTWSKSPDLTASISNRTIDT